MSRERRRERALRARRRQQRRRRQRIAYIALVAGIALFATWLVARPLVRSWFPRTPSTVLRVQANMAGFQPFVISAQAGRPITVQLESMDTRFHLDGGGRHQFAIDELGVNIIAPPLGVAEETFVVEEPGEYRFYCSICCGGKANPSMWGTLIVKS